MPERGMLPIALPVAALVLAVVAVVATTRTWTVTVTADFAPTAHPMWTSGSAAAVGAAVLVLGAVLALAGAATAGRVRPAVSGGLVATGAGAAVVAAVVLLADRYAPVPDLVQPVTVAIARFTPGPNQVPFSPQAVSPAWVVVVAAGVLAVAVAVLAARRHRSEPRPRTAVLAIAVPAAVGVAAVLVGATTLPWAVGSDLGGELLWASGAGAAVGAVLAIVGGLAAAAAAVRPGRPAARPTLAVMSVLAAAVGLGLLVAQRVPHLWGGGDFGWYGYAPLEALTTDVPSPAALHAATVLVLGGGALVTLLRGRRDLAAPARAGDGTGDRGPTGDRRLRAGRDPLPSTRVAHDERLSSSR